MAKTVEIVAETTEVDRLNTILLVRSPSLAASLSPAEPAQ
jgi:hypothetical protein